MPLPRTLLAMLVSILAVVGFVVWSGMAAADGMPTPPPRPAVAACPAGFTMHVKTSGTAPGGGLKLSTARIDQFRAGRHDPCYDRFVVDVAGKPGGFRVGYVSEITSDPKGDVLTVPGQARLLVTIGNPVAHAAGFPTPGAQLIPTKRLASWVEFRSVIFAGSFENVTSIGLGVNEPRPFRVFVLPPGPGHPHTGMIVVDVAQH
jgi:hypothetical protein